MWENLRASINQAVGKYPMYLTRKILLGAIVAVLGMVVFAFPEITMHNQSSAALPMLAAAVLLATGIVLVVAEVKMIWLKSH
jgi:drug/metabolite transporter (DMT)-like permease